MDSNFNLSFPDILRFIGRGLPVALIGATIVGAVVFMLSQTLPEQFEASATVLAAQNTGDSRSFDTPLVSAPTLDVSAYRKAVLSNPVLRQVMTEVGLEDQTASAVEDFRNTITIHTESATDSSLIDIKVKNTSPQAAMTRSNLLAEALVNWDKARASESLNRVVLNLNEQVAVADRQIQALRDSGASEDQIAGQLSLRAQHFNQLEVARALSSSAAGLLSIIEPALLPEEPVAPRPLLNTAIAAILTMLLAYGLLHLLDSLNPGNVEQVAEAGGLPVLASFPKLATNNRKLPTEATNYLRTNLLFSSGDITPKVILVTSARGGEGKTSVAMSLAESFVRNGSYTLLVDANLRNPEIADNYKMLSSRLAHTALATWLQNPQATRDVVRLTVAGNDLHVIPSFKADSSAAELLSSSFRTCLDHWKEEYDVIIIDSAPVLEVADTLSIAPYCSDTVLVANEQLTKPRHLRSAIDVLRRIGVKLAGVVATAAKEEGNNSFAEHFSPPKASSFGLFGRNPTTEKEV